jgi:hypothetical protein
MFCAGATGILFSSTAAQAGSVLQLNLQDLTQRAATVFRGRVLSASAGSAVVGGVELPTVTYKFQVDDALLGDFKTAKGVTYAEITTIGKVRSKQAGQHRSVAVVPQMPKLIAGKSYFLFVTAPTATGLSTTVGLGQGSFALSQVGDTLMAENQLKNEGLFRGMRGYAGPSTGAIPYDELRARVRALAGTP